MSDVIPATNPLQLPAPTSPNLFAVHASVTIGANERVWAIYLFSFGSGRQWRVGDNVGGYNVTADEVRQDPDVLEAAVLTHFRDFATANPNATYVHWHQSRDDYGFDVWKRRAIHHGIAPWPELDTLDLENVLRNAYGPDHYGPEPPQHFLRALDNNGINRDGMLDFAASREAIEARNYRAIDQSNQNKVVAVAKLYIKAHRGEYRGGAAAVHSVDFRSVNWFGAEYHFTPNQAACIKALWTDWQQGTRDIGAKTLLELADSNAERIDLVFRKHPAWGTMIVSGKTKGAYRLNPPA